MARFFLRIFFFMIIVIGLLTALIYAASKIKYNEKGSILRQITGNPVKRGGDPFIKFHEAATNTKPIDILVFGSSRAFRAFDPAVFDKHGLNIHILATISQTPTNTYYLVKRYLPLLKPKMVILDIHLGLLNNQGLESFFDLCANMPMSPEHFYMAMAINQPSAYTVWYSSMIQQLGTPIYKDINYNPPKGYYKGFLSDSKKDTLLTISENDTAMVLRKLTPMELKNLNYFEKTIQYILGQGIPVIITRQPLIGKDAINSSRRVRNLASLYQINYYDLNKYENLLNPKRDFYDKGHLNANGALLVSETVIREIEKAGYKIK